MKDQTDIEQLVVQVRKERRRARLLVAFLILAFGFAAVWKVHNMLEHMNAFCAKPLPKDAHPAEVQITTLMASNRLTTDWAEIQLFIVSTAISLFVFLYLIAPSRRETLLLRLAERVSERDRNANQPTSPGDVATRAAPEK
jgi:predicted nucleic acid-binding Zn ribbon protein